MRVLKGLYVVVASGAVLGAAACSGPSAPPLPGSYGLYARNDDHLMRLDGSPDWERETWDRRSDLSLHSALIAFDRSLVNALPDETLILQNVAWVRYQVTADAQSDVRQVGEWAVTDLPEFRVALNYFPVPQNAEMIEMHPRQELLPGLYSLKLHRSDSVLASRFGVAWDDVDRDSYNQANCVDRYVIDGQTSFRPCGDAAGGPAAGRLEIGDVKTARVDVGVPSLVITGVVHNPSAAPLPVPMLDATMKDAEGNELGRQSFALDRKMLAPGASADFRLMIDHPPNDVSLVSIGVAPNASTANAQ